jgi:hypothetical protein
LINFSNPSSPAVTSINPNLGGGWTVAVNPKGNRLAGGNAVKQRGLSGSSKEVDLIKEKGGFMDITEAGVDRSISSLTGSTNTAKVGDATDGSKPFLDGDQGMLPSMARFENLREMA